ncbi:MAG: TIGR01777 family oxidoreductase [Waddliaceae bacterium]
MKVLILGSSGLVGTALVSYLNSKGNEVIRGTRDSNAVDSDMIYWDPKQGEFNLDVFEGYDAVINLAGESIGSGSWSEEKKKKIKESRVLGTQILAQCLSHLKNPPKVLINASAVGYYGSRGDTILTEESAPGSGFLSDVCQEWEAATTKARESGIRVVCMRFGMVLSQSGGVLGQMLPVFKAGLGGVIGPGNQYMSFVAIDDLVKMIQFVMEKEAIEGPVNAVAEEAVTNQVFTKTLGNVLSRPTFIPLPAFAARLMLGKEKAEELTLASQRVEPTVLQRHGYTFQYPKLSDALNYLLG